MMLERAEPSWVGKNSAENSLLRAVAGGVSEVVAEDVKNARAGGEDACGARCANSDVPAGGVGKSCWRGVDTGAWVGGADSSGLVVFARGTSETADWELELTRAATRSGMGA